MGTIAHHHHSLSSIPTKLILLPILLPVFQTLYSLVISFKFTQLIIFFKYFNINRLFCKFIPIDFSNGDQLDSTNDFVKQLSSSNTFDADFFSNEDLDHFEHLQMLPEPNIDAVTNNDHFRL